MLKILLKVTCMDIRFARSLSGSTGVSHVTKESYVAASVDEVAADLFNITVSNTALGGSGNDDVISTIDDATAGATPIDNVWLELYLFITFLIAINTRPWP